MRSTRTWLASVVIVAVVLACALSFFIRPKSQPHESPEIPTAQPPHSNSSSVEDRVKQYGEAVRARLEPSFHRAGVAYPPAAVVFVGLKQEKTLEIYAAGIGETRFRFIRSYPILAASGHAGPKLREGDLQVPEGLYRIESLNPNSLYHLALRVNYPSEFDLAQAAKEHWVNLGEDIMIHGNAMSAGCLAMGDQAAEDLFVLAALTGIKNIQVVLSPVDCRVRNMPAPSPDSPIWLGGMYENIREELKKYPVVN